MWRLKRCCCFSLQTGTTIIGILFNIIGPMLNMYLILNMSEVPSILGEDTVNKNFREGFPLPITSVTKSLVCTFDVITIIVGLLMLYGNLNDKRKLMIPFVYPILFYVVVYNICMIVRMVETRGSLNGARPLTTIFYMVVETVVDLFVCHAVRCRMLEIDEKERPVIPFTPVHPNATVYGQTKADEEQLSFPV